MLYPVVMPSPRLNLPQKLHLRPKAAFDAVFDARARENRGPLVFHARPNGLTHHRFGMSVSRKVGIAVKRNRIRRLLRESFRLLQHDLPNAYDFVVIVRPHEALTLEQYQTLMKEGLAKLDVVWKRRDASTKPTAPT